MRREAAGAEWRRRGRARRLLSAALRLLFLAAPLATGAPAAALCGDGVLDAGEACDDGNLSDADCCSGQCELLACPAPPQPAVAWRELGPFMLGGRVSAFAVDPADPDRLLAGTPDGGLWESGDAGASWQPVAPWLGALPLSAVAIAPDDPDTILVGTGTLSDAGSTRGAGGLLRSEDGGRGFQVAAGTGDAPYLAAALFWPGEPDRVLVATDLGLRLSRDRGARFQEVLRGDAISALAPDPFDPDAVWAAGRLGLYRSDDRGRSWTRLADWPLAPDDLYGSAVQALAASSITPGRLWALVQVRAGLTATDRVLLLRSDDGGASFQVLPGLPPLCPGPRTCGFALALAVDPADDQRLLLGGDRLYASHDGGQSWTSLGDALQGVHALRTEQGGAAWAAGDLGVARVGPSWSDATLRNDGLAITGTASLAASGESPPRLLLGSQRNGTLLGFGDPPGWQTIFGEHAPAGAVCFDPFDPARLFASRRGGDLVRSDDGGASFTSATAGLDLGESALNVAPLAASPLLQDVFYTGRLSLFRSPDAGSSWSRFRPEGFPEIAVIAPSRVVEDRVFFALAEGATLYRTDWIFTNTFVVDPDPDQRIAAIWLDRDDERRIYLAVNDTARRRGRVLKTSDGGTTWSDVSPPQMDPATGLVKDVHGALYVSTVSGVLRSANEGATWATFEEALPPGGVRALGLGGGRLFAGTEGRGVFDVPLRELTVLDSVPPGRRFLVDGELREGPVYLDWDPGSAHHVEPYLLQTADTRQRFVSWSDGGVASHDVVAADGNAWLTAAIRESYRLEASAFPPEGGEITLDPPSPDGFYDSGTFVTAIAAPAPDHRFVGFEGSPSGTDGVLGYARMDRPRTLRARFEPLRVTLRSEPPGLDLQVDGQTVAAPASFSWEAGSRHALAAPDRVDPDPSDPFELAFDAWSHLRPRQHEFVMRRDTFVADLVAHYVNVLPQLAVPAAGVRAVRGVGREDAPRQLTLRAAAGGAAPALLQIARSRIEGTDVQELALVPTEPVRERVAWVEGDGTHRLRTLIGLHNPGAGTASVDLTLWDEAGALGAATAAPVEVEPGATRRLDVRGTLAADPYAGMLRIVSDVPLAMHVQRVRENVRPLEYVDAVRSVSFAPADRGVPGDGVHLALVRGPATRQRLALLNPGTTTLAGEIRFRDESGGDLALDLGAGPAASHSYQIPPHGHRLLELALAPTAAGSPGGSVLETVQVRVVPSSGAPPPQLDLLEEETVGDVGHGPLRLPRSRPPSRDRRRFRLPLAQDLRDAGVIAANPHAAPVALTLRARDADGGLVAETVVTLAPGAQQALLAGEVLPELPGDLRGWLEGEAADPLAVVGAGLATNGRGEALHLGFPLPTARAGDARFPVTLESDSWSTALFVLNPSAQPLVADLVTTDREGEPLPWPVLGSVLP